MPVNCIIKLPFLSLVLLAIIAASGCGSGADGGGGSGPTWIDTTTGYTWQRVPPGAQYYIWREAVGYCKDLTLDGKSDWRLPTISELRTIIRGCTATQPGGACNVTDSCLLSTCWSEATCRSCKTGEGPAGGVFWDSNLDGFGGAYWSISPWTYTSGVGAWRVGFGDGSVDNANLEYITASIRCVRN